MSRVKIDGHVRLGFVVGEDGIADIHAPEETEVNDASSILDLHHQLTPDGFAINLTEDTKDVGRFDSDFNANEPGRAGGSIDLTYFRDSIEANEKAQTFMVRDQRGSLVARYGPPASQPFADGDKVEVYPVMCGNQRPGPTPKNSDRTTVQTLQISDQWDIDATIGGES